MKKPSKATPKTTTIRRLLIANRGEIACRIINTCQRLGIETVAIYSEPDQEALFTQMATQAVFLGGVHAKDNYLNIQKIIEVAKLYKVDAIHPGYGFLSENPDFAKAVTSADMIFIGPSSKSMQQVGLKDAAKNLARALKIPVVPGYDGQDQSMATLTQQAQSIGLPLLIKAAAGGGGRGMRIVRDWQQLSESIESAKREATNHFGLDTLVLERYIDESRHLEVQIFADQHGNVVHLFERDCSIQRRYQKIIEEAPCPFLDDTQRQNICKHATDLALAVDYVGAGTVEFIFDCKTKQFYFMEVNARLQVEHPITEMITGLDLVEWQIRVAEGHPLPLSQHSIQHRGHAIEVRLCAEDALHEFRPSLGVIHDFDFPDSDLPHNVNAPYIRIDHGISPKTTISPYYDSMIAKIIAWGKDRTSAIDVLHSAIQQTHIVGVQTNAGLLNAILLHPDFLHDQHQSTWLERQLKNWLNEWDAKDKTLDSQILIASALSSINPLDLLDNRNKHGWSCDGWRMGGKHEWSTLIHDKRTDTPHHLSITHHPATHLWSARINGRCIDGEYVPMTWEWIHSTCLRLNDQCFFVASDSDKCWIEYQHRSYELGIGLYQPKSSLDHGTDGLLAPLPGVITKIFVETGAVLAAGTPILAMEAMKMEHVLRTPTPGSIQKFHINVGDQVAEGQTLFDFTEDSTHDLHS